MTTVIKLNGADSDQFEKLKIGIAAVFNRVPSNPQIVRALMALVDTHYDEMVTEVSRAMGRE